VSPIARDAISPGKEEGERGGEGEEKPRRKSIARTRSPRRVLSPRRRLPSPSAQIGLSHSRLAIRPGVNRVSRSRRKSMSLLRGRTGGTNSQKQAGRRPKPPRFGNRARRSLIGVITRNRGVSLHLFLRRVAFVRLFPFFSFFFFFLFFLLSPRDAVALSSTDWTTFRTAEGRSRGTQCLSLPHANCLFRDRHKGGTDGESHGRNLARKEVSFRKIYSLFQTFTSSDVRARARLLSFLRNILSPLTAKKYFLPRVAVCRIHPAEAGQYIYV